MAAQTGAETGAIWKGKRGKYHIVWASSNLLVTRAGTGQVVLDAAADAKAEWNKLARSGSGAREAEFTYHLLSAVGPYLSIRKREDCDCGGARPTSVARSYAIDLDRSSPTKWAPISLEQIFGANAVLEALSKDSAVRRILGSANPESLNALLSRLEDERLSVHDCEFEFPPELLSGFVFYEVRQGKVGVRIGLPHAVETCRGQMTQLGLELPVPEAHRKLFEDGRIPFTPIRSHSNPKKLQRFAAFNPLKLCASPLT